jgi:amino acid transporter
VPSTSTTPSAPSALSNSLARDRIGAPGISLAIASSVAPLTVVAGVVTTAIAVTGLTAVSAAMLAVAFALLVFAVGYVAMARHITNTGAFYAYVSKGLGRPLGVGTSWIALLSYNSFQIASYGGFGFILAPLFETWFGLDLPWWVYAVIAWAIVAYLGQREVSVSEKVLAVLVIGETLLVLIYAAAIFSTEGFQFDSSAWDFAQVFGAGGGALLAVAATGFAGVEQGAVYIEESKDPKRSVARATFATIILIALLYSVASWVQISAAGGEAVDRARAEGPNMFFIQSSGLGNWTVDVGNLLFATSLLAAMIAFHNIIARYTYALGREGVLPTRLGRTVGGAPRNASFAQSALALIVLCIYLIGGFDPLVQLFFWGGTTGGVGVLLLITLTSAAVIGFFLRGSRGESVWRRFIAPVIATALLLVISYLAVTNLSTLYGVEPNTGPALVMPIVALIVLVLGVIWGLVLRQTRPEVYAGIGLGPDSAIAAKGSGGGFAAMMAGSESGPDSTPQDRR